MGLLAEAFNPKPRAEAWDESAPPWSDFWYRDPNTGFALERGGVAMSADTIMRCGTVLAALRFRGDSWAMCPPSTYRKTATGRVEMPEHYSQQVLRDPNRWQTDFDWRHLNGVWMGSWGNAYNEIVAGPRSFADELRPMHPQWTRVADQRSDGSLVYVTHPPGQDERVLGQERVLHFMDISTDGFRGLEMYKLIRGVVSIALLAEQHAATFLKKGARLSGLLVPAHPMEEDDRNKLRESVNKTMAGPSATGTYGLLPFGVDLKPISNTHREAQFVELTNEAVAAILRFLGVPGVVVGFADKTATYASAEAFFEKGGIKHCVLPILSRVEARLMKSLLVRGSGLQIKHNLDVLMRANTKDRFDALFKAVGAPWMSRNEARRIEDMNEDPDPEMGKVLTPVNMSTEPPEPEPGPAMPEAPGGPPPAMPDDDDEEDASEDAATADRLRQFATAAAARVARREIKSVLALAPRNARDATAWRAAVLRLYDQHAAHVAGAMLISSDAARGYCESQAAVVLARGAGVVESWEKEIPPQLVALALRQPAGGEA